MRSLTIVFITALALACDRREPRCTDFSGQYVVAHEDGRVYYTFRQSGCASMVVRRSTDRTFAVDVDSNTVLLDGRVHGQTTRVGPRRQASVAVVSADTFVIVTNTEVPGQPGIASVQKWVRLANGDLCFMHLGPEGTWSYVAARDTGSADAAAWRSENRTGDLTRSCS